MKSFLLSTLCIFASTIAASSQQIEGVLARCGASEGQGYFFFDETFNPDGPGWETDGIRNGKIVLIHLGDEWDILFDDIVGASGYRNDGANVIPLGGFGDKFTIGAFRETYTDIYTFDFARKEVVWSSHKIGTLIKKVGIYRAPCQFVSRN